MDRRTLDMLSVVILASVALLLATLLFDHFRIQQTADRQPDGGNGTHDNQRAANPVEPIPQAVNAKSDNGGGNGQARQRDNQNQKIDTNQTIADADSSIALFTMWLVIVGGVAAILQLTAIVVSIIATRASRQSANAAEISANAARDAANHAETTFLLQHENTKKELRAYLSIERTEHEHPAFAPGDGHRPFEIRLDIIMKNSGQTPAYDVDARIYALVAPNAYGGAFINNPPCPSLAQSICGPGQIAHRYRTVQMSTADCEKLYRDKEALWAYGYVTYLDVFKNYHELRFRTYFEIDHNGRMDTIFHFSTEGNFENDLLGSPPPEHIVRPL